MAVTITPPEKQFWSQIVRVGGSAAPSTSLFHRSRRMTFLRRVAATADCHATAVADANENKMADGGGQNRRLEASVTTERSRGALVPMYGAHHEGGGADAEDDDDDSRMPRPRRADPLLDPIYAAAEEERRQVAKLSRSWKKIVFERQTIAKEAQQVRTQLSGFVRRAAEDTFELETQLGKMRKELGHSENEGLRCQQLVSQFDDLCKAKEMENDELRRQLALIRRETHKTASEMERWITSAKRSIDVLRDEARSLEDEYQREVQMQRELHFGPRTDPPLVDPTIYF